jgi:hypothetical protein
MKMTKIDIGSCVYCDFCNVDYAGKSDTGGVLFQGKAVCPQCVPKLEADVRCYGEEHFIRARCPDGKSFAEWVLWLRGGDNTITIYE